MSRTRDIVLARLRMLAERWWGADPTDAGPAAGATADPRRWPVDPALPVGPDLPEGAGRDRGLAAALADAAPGDLLPGGSRWWPEFEHDLATASSGEGGPGEDPAAAGGVPVGPQVATDAIVARDARPRVWLALGALTCAGALAVAGATAVRGWPRVESPPAAAPTAEVDLVPFTSPSEPTMVVVHVAGEVREPGVVTLPAGSRVADALRAAGGLRRGGRLGPTNLARVVADGERIEIGGQDAGTANGPAGGAGASGPLDLNTATAEQLDALPGVGPVTAAKILAWRAEHGRFSVVDELAEVPGIGPKTLEELRPHVRV